MRDILRGAAGYYGRARFPLSVSLSLSSSPTVTRD